MCDEKSYLDRLLDAVRTYLAESAISIDGPGAAERRRVTTRVR
jgi:hypothetical protein